MTTEEKKPKFTKIEGNLRRPSWLIQDVLPASPYGQTGMLVGKTGIGKSFIAIDWACSVASGTDWQGHRVRKPKTVVYLCGEGQDGVDARILAWLKFHGLEPEALRKLYLFSETADLDGKASALVLLGTMQQEGVHPDLIIVDALNNYFSGDERSSNDIRNYLDNFVALMEKEFGATVVTICWPEVCVNTTFKGAMDFVFAVNKYEQDIVLSQTKVKDGRPWEIPMSFEFSKDIPIGEYYEPDEDGKTDVYSAVLLENRDSMEVR